MPFRWRKMSFLPYMLSLIKPGIPPLYSFGQMLSKPNITPIVIPKDHTSVSNPYGFPYLISGDIYRLDTSTILSMLSFFSGLNKLFLSTNLAAPKFAILVSYSGVVSDSMILSGFRLRCTICLLCNSFRDSAIIPISLLADTSVNLFLGYISLSALRSPPVATS